MNQFAAAAANKNDMNNMNQFAAQQGMINPQALMYQNQLMYQVKFELFKLVHCL